MWQQEQKKVKILLINIALLQLALWLNFRLD